MKDRNRLVNETRAAVIKKIKNKKTKLATMAQNGRAHRLRTNSKRDLQPRLMIRVQNEVSAEDMVSVNDLE